MSADGLRRILVPVDGSEAALRAVRFVIAERDAYRFPPHVVLLNVQPAVLSGAVKLFITRDRLDDFYREEGSSALLAARDLVAASTVSHEQHILVGDPAEVISRQAVARECHSIVMGTRGLGAVSSMVLGSVATKVIHLSPMPVTLIK